jgi:hypothetical protein
VAYSLARRKAGAKMRLGKDDEWERNLPMACKWPLETILLNLASHSDGVSALVRARLSFPYVYLVVGQPFQAVVLTGWKAGPWSFYILKMFYPLGQRSVASPPQALT